MPEITRRVIRLEPARLLALKCYAIGHQITLCEVYDTAIRWFISRPDLQEIEFQRPPEAAPTLTISVEKELLKLLAQSLIRDGVKCANQMSGLYTAVNLYLTFAKDLVVCE